MPLLPSNERHNCQKQAFTIKKKTTVSSQGQHLLIHKTSLFEQEDCEAEKRQAYVNETVVSRAVLYPLRPP